ncbi:hypothetical protein [Actinomadura gamaensis]|uniref:Uncharacterized protein n=1 Tax=Actinomadura gamaensis TaxID=1763541 RepID=A0ABV9TRC9_9ACTN
MSSEAQPPQQEAQPSQQADSGPPWLRITLALVAAATAIAIALIPVLTSLLSGKNDSGDRHPTAQSATCPLAESSTTASVVSHQSASYPDLRLQQMSYKLTYGHHEAAPHVDAPAMRLEPAGQITGGVPADQTLYPFLWADPHTRDNTPQHHPGPGRYFWHQNTPIQPDSRGCWNLPESPLGYSDAQGLTFRFYFGLVPRTQEPCLRKLLSSRSAEQNGLDGEALSACSVTLLGYGIIPT